jgi:hypothetical protein
MAAFVKWMLEDGQNTAMELHYVRLPNVIVQEAAAEVPKLH